VASGGEVIGTGYVNPRSLICARIVSRAADRPLSRDLLRERLKEALSLRARLYESPYYRLVHGEGDGLPGLVVDRDGAVLVVQTNTAGMERFLDEVIDALVEVLHPQAILFRNDGPNRVLEGLEAYVRVAFGEVGDELAVVENGVRFRLPACEGQKTGWYFDQSLNRARMLRYVRGGRVLDAFSYLGAWGITAAVGGAQEVRCIESSASACVYIERNAVTSGIEDRVRAIRGEAMEVLKTFQGAGERFDVVILDPPSYIKRKKDLAAGFVAYRRLNQAAMSVLARGGILITCSCSYHLEDAALMDVIRRAAQRVKRSVQVVEQLHQAPDHPVHPAMPETRYLKGFVCRVL
jgi:23S rRNA (cytosine1962-C5)-methyltransferase